MKMSFPSPILTARVRKFFYPDPELVVQLSFLVTENAFLGMAARMMLLSRRRPRHPASTGKEGRGEAKKAQGGKKRAASGRKRRKTEKVMHFGFGIAWHTNGITVQETGGGINPGKG